MEALPLADAIERYAVLFPLLEPVRVGKAMAWAYEPDEVPKRKHSWSSPAAGFAAAGTGKFVGKCPSLLTIEMSRELLNDAIPWSPKNWRAEYPKRLYAVREGVLYRATPTNPGRSYHGFPEHPSRFPVGARSLKDALLARARTEGSEEELRQWMNW